MEFQEITVLQLKELLANDEPLQLLDVREPAEYRLGFIKKALNIPLQMLSSEHGRLSRQVPVVVYCHHGQASTLAVDYLTRTHGFDNLYLLAGGLHAWATEVDQGVLWY
ncbi:MAG: rhodanese-like domain-containing protein [Cytophagales bacterium]|jgi:adenylyltransferase/sulfurtransferase|nr:rhodanese-like domain-containing protein [Cytophagales bacterium]